MLRSILTLFIVLAAWSLSPAQVTTSPSPLQEDSRDVCIFFHADQGNRGMAGLPATAQVYAHTGACLSDGSKWVNAPKWEVNQDKYRLEYVSADLWKLYIGDIRTFYGITDPEVSVTQLAFVFRTGDRTKEGKGTGNTDIFVDVMDSGLQVSLTSSIEGNLVNSLNASATFSIGATMDADLTLLVNDAVIAQQKGVRQLTADYTFAGPGNYTVTARAAAGGESAEQSLTYTYVSASDPLPWPGGGTPVMGPSANTDGSVTFCLGAPGKMSVIIVGEWDGYAVDDKNVMHYTDCDGMRYFWITVPGLERDRMYGYYFLVDGTYRVSDPYARLVLDPWNDKYISTDVFPGLPPYPIEHIDGVPLAIWLGSINDYEWRCTDFKGAAPSDLIIYELLLRDFTGTEGKALGNGTVRQAIEKIPYLKELGVNAVELLPINDFSGNISWGYNPNFYFAPDKAYGTPADYKEFIDLCHQSGIAVILDVVFNQSDGLHPWYQMYMPGENPFYNLNAPHAYSVLNDWNQGFPLVQRQWHDMLRYWMEEYRIDGFRFDLVKGLGDNDSYANSGDAATNAYNASRVQRMAELKAVVSAVNPDAYFINENLASAQEENAMAKDGELNWANFNNQGCQYAMGQSSDSGLAGMFAVSNGRLWGSTVSYLESHDEERLAYKQSKYGVTGIKGNTPNSMARLGSAAAQMILAPGAHMIWQFSELGNYDTTKNSDGGNNTDPKTVRWNLLDNAYRRGLHDSYAELISIRTSNPDLFAESATYTARVSAADWTNGRTMSSRSGEKELHTVINPNVKGDITVTVNFASKSDADYRIMSKTYNTTPVFSAAAKTVTVPANSYVVIGTADVSEVSAVTGDASALEAYGDNGELVIAAAPGRVDIYSLDGRRVAQTDGQARIALRPGIYVARCGAGTVKVLVR